MNEKQLKIYEWLRRASLPDQNGRYTPGHEYFAEAAEELKKVCKNTSNKGRTLKENDLVLGGKNRNIVLILKKKEDKNWWTAGVVFSENEHYPVGGYDLSVHGDDVVLMEITRDSKHFRINVSE